MNSDSNSEHIKNIVGRKKDEIRKLYVMKNNKLYCTIEGCNKNFSKKTSVISLKHHIYNHTTNRDKNMDIRINIPKMDIDESAVYKTFATAFAKNSLPYSLLDNKYFMKIVRVIYLTPAEGNFIAFVVFNFDV